jgi:polyisoprenoid-binding protein YceI
MRDGHLKAPDLFDVEEFPKATFKSTGVDRNSDHYKIVGDQTIRDVTKEVSLDAEYSGIVKGAYGEDRFGFSATTDLRRRDFGLEWNAPLPTGGFLVGDTIGIEIDGAGVQQQ